MTSPAERSPNSSIERNLSTWFLQALGVVFLMQLAVSAVRPTVSYRALDLGANAAQLGLIAAGFAALSLVFAIPIGRMIDQRGEMPFIIVGLVLVTAVALVLVIIDTIWALFLTQAVLGVGQVLTTVGMQALIANSDSRHRDSRFGAFTVFVSLGQLAGPAMAGALSQHVNLAQLQLPGTDLAGTSAFLAAGLAGLLGCGLAFGARRAGSRTRGDRSTPPPAPVSLIGSIGRVLHQPNAPHAMLASIAVLTTTDLLVAYLPAFGDAAGLSATTVGLLLSARAGAAMVSRLFLGTLTGRIGHGRLLVLSTALPAFVLAPFPLLHSSSALFATMMVAGFGLGLGQPLSLIWIAQTAPEDSRGTAVGVRLSGNRLGQVAIPALIGGIVGATGIGAVFVALSVMLAGSAMMTATARFDSETSGSA